MPHEWGYAEFELYTSDKRQKTKFTHDFYVKQLSLGNPVLLQGDLDGEVYLTDEAYKCFIDEYHCLENSGWLLTIPTPSAKQA